jgi:hypothetical protein
MNLTVWDQEGDFFTHQQLSADLQAIDSHDHSPTNGKQINTAGIVPGAITTTLMAAASVTNAILAANAVATANIQNSAVTGSKIASGAIDGTKLQNGSIDFLQLASDVLPLGSILLWWRPSGSTATPGGPWEIMDGRAWNSISNTMGNSGSSLTTGNIPDMRNVFPIGADINGSSGPAIGVSGGAATANVAHTHTIGAHSHSVNPHTHPISTDGLHYHTWGISFSANPDYPEGLVVSGLDTWYRTNAFPAGITVKDYPGNNQRQNVYGTLYIKNATYDIFGSPGVTIDAPAHMDNGGSHSHGGATGADGGGATNAIGLTSDSSLGSISTVPPNTALLFIMRVR